MDRRIQIISVTLGWAGALVGLTLWGIFQGVLVPVRQAGGGQLPEVAMRSVFSPWLFYLGVLAASILAGLVLSDLARAIISFLMSYLVAAVIIFFLLILPDITGSNYDPYGSLIGLAVSVALPAFFPFPLVLGLLGTFLGGVLAERYL